MDNERGGIRSIKKNKKKRHMFNFIVKAVDRFFYQVYDGEPLNARRHSDTILEEEVLFCKNNVCVHYLDKNINEEKHIPGYLCIKKIYKAEVEISDLLLSWTPNSLLKTGNLDDAEIVVGDSEEIARKTNTEDYSTKAYPFLINNKNYDSLNSSKENFDLPQGSDVFSVNLLDMKTLKIFYSGIEKDCGQFVIGSHENEYKVFHFNNTGFLKLTEIFDSWNGCVIDADIIAEEVGQQVYYIKNNDKQNIHEGLDIHPDEKRYKPMNLYTWHGFVNQNGQVEDGYNFRKHVFFGGLSQEARPDAWKFLMCYYPMHSTIKERELVREDKRKKYEAIHNKRLGFTGEEYEKFWRNVQFTVDKDVVRTDRSHPYYAGEDNPNIQKMRNILLNYAVYNPIMGYTQGMSDLVAPVLATLHDEIDSFWCFVGLMETSMFATSPKDDSMDKSLGFLRELLRIITPEFYMHCLSKDYDLNLLFAHRWLVLCFKREFIYHEVLKIWEACWTRYQTDHFHIFICVAIVNLYGDVCIQKKWDSDEVLQYFTDMATKFDGSAVLREARSILFKFRQFSRIPCTLCDLLSGNGVWDGGIAPEVECVSHYRRCCFGNEEKDKVIEETTDKHDSKVDVHNLKASSNKTNSNEDESNGFLLEQETTSSIESTPSQIGDNKQLNENNKDEGCHKINGGTKDNSNVELMENNLTPVNYKNENDNENIVNVNSHHTDESVSSQRNQNRDPDIQSLDLGTKDIKHL